MTDLEPSEHSSPSLEDCPRVIGSYASRLELHVARRATANRRGSILPPMAAYLDQLGPAGKPPGWHP
jgi:hypothetical protein